MDIKSLTANGLNNRVTDSSNNANRSQAGSNASASAKSADKVTLSSVIDVNDLEQKAKTGGVDNSARIEALKQQIKDGTYQVDADKVASKLIETETLLSGA
ncbi:MAG: flagellar biosynthesis anti-sigma factor FlgM [Hydrogenovibrio sp.]|nr:flagellar biosynthesis anti-sigma factor FlgM [Hydrogenovibrio sp.]